MGWSGCAPPASPVTGCLPEIVSGTAAVPQKEPACCNAKFGSLGPEAVAEPRTLLRAAGTRLDRLGDPRAAMQNGALRGDPGHVPEPARVKDVYPAAFAMNDLFPLEVLQQLVHGLATERKHHSEALLRDAHAT
jgi:hypothetical protein